MWVGRVDYTTLIPQYFLLNDQFTVWGKYTIKGNCIEPNFSHYPPQNFIFPLSLLPPSHQKYPTPSESRYTIHVQKGLQFISKINFINKDLSICPQKQWISRKKKKPTYSEIRSIPGRQQIQDKHVHPQSPPPPKTWKEGKPRMRQRTVGKAEGTRKKRTLREKGSGRAGPLGSTLCIFPGQKTRSRNETEPW